MSGRPTCDTMYGPMAAISPPMSAGVRPVAAQRSGLRPGRGRGRAPVVRARRHRLARPRRHRPRCGQQGGAVRRLALILPFPLDGGRVGMGARAVEFQKTQMALEAFARPRVSPELGGHTPTLPFPPSRGKGLKTCVAAAGGRPWPSAAGGSMPGAHEASGRGQHGGRGGLRV